jgi:acyl-CoA reductase-like NAD-dependent aldehyde dehydrogenase
LTPLLTREHIVTLEEQAEAVAFHSLISRVIPRLPLRSLLDTERVESVRIVRDAVRQASAEMVDSEWHGVEPASREALMTRVAQRLDEQAEDWKRGHRSKE